MTINVQIMKSIFENVKITLWEKGKILVTSMFSFSLNVLESLLLNLLPDDKILDWPKLKQIADDISKCI